MDTQDCHCPFGSKWDTKECVICSNGQLWDEPSRRCICPRGTMLNGGTCRILQQCYGGMIWNQNIWECECPVGTVFNGHFCLSNPCSSGRVWNETQKGCQCQDGKIYMMGACVPPRIDCTNGKVWDKSIYACTCPEGTFASVHKCDQIPFCRNGKVYNPLNNKC